MRWYLHAEIESMLLIRDRPHKDCDPEQQRVRRKNLIMTLYYIYTLKLFVNGL